MATEIFTLAFVTVNGGLISKAGSVSFQRQTNSNAVLTLALGYAGESPGARMMQGSIQMFVPQADFELNVDAYMEALEPVEIGFLVASRVAVVKAFFIEDSFKQSTNSPAEYDVNFRGGFARFQ